MPAPRELVDLYLHLARASEEQRRLLQSNKFLVLAARIACQAGATQIAEECRRRILAHNPNHLLKSFASMAEALRSEDVCQYTHQLTRLYPFEKAEYLLHKFRAGGYSGDHGYGQLVASLPTRHGESGAPSPSAERSGGLKSRESASNRSVPGPRPALKKAIEETEGSAPADVRNPRRPSAAATGPATVPHRSDPAWSVLCWLLFAFALGVALGGAAVTFLLPSP